MLTIDILIDIHVREPEGDVLIFMTGQVWSLFLVISLSILRLCILVYFIDFGFTIPLITKRHHCT